MVSACIKGVLRKQLDRQTAHTVAVLTGYFISALREARGGKLRLSVFLQDVQKSNLTVEMFSREQMDRFLQGDETVQMEVLQEIQQRSGSVTAEVRALPVKVPQARIDKELISEMSGLTTDEVKDVFSGNADEAIEVENRLLHDWMPTAGGIGRFCQACGMRKEKLEPQDMESTCSGEWGLH